MNISSNKQFIELFLAQLELNAPHAPLHLEFVAYSFLHFLPPLQINIISWTILEYLKQIIKLLRRKKLFTDNTVYSLLKTFRNKHFQKTSQYSAYKLSIAIISVGVMIQYCITYVFQKCSYLVFAALSGILSLLNVRNWNDLATGLEAAGEHRASLY